MAFAAQLPADLDAVHVGQHPVEDHERVVALARHRHAGEPGAGDVDHVALGLEPAHDEAGDAGVVLDEQQLGH